MISSYLKLNAVEQLSIPIILGNMAHENLYPTIINTIHQINTKLPVGFVNTIYFLGIDESLPVERFLKDGSYWLKRHSRRVSLVAPIFTAMTKNGDAAEKCIVINNGPIFDLEDWVDQRKFYIIDLQDTIRFDIPSIEQFAIRDLAGLINVLQNPIERLEVSFLSSDVHPPDGSGTDIPKQKPLLLSHLPYFWKNPQMFWDRSMLVQEEADPEHGWDNFIYVLGETYCQPKATLFFRDGATQVVSLIGEIEEETFASENSWLALDEKERRIFLKSVRGQSFTCPHCEQPHPPGTFFCTEKDDWGNQSPIYKTFLKNMWRSGLLLFRLCNNGQIEVSRPICEALKISETEIVIHQTQQRLIRLYLYAPEQKSWLQQPVWSGFRKIGTNLFGAVL